MQKRDQEPLVGMKANLVVQKNFGRAKVIGIIKQKIKKLVHLEYHNYLVEIKFQIMLLIIRFKQNMDYLLLKIGRIGTTSLNMVLQLQLGIFLKKMVGIKMKLLTNNGLNNLLLYNSILKTIILKEIISNLMQIMMGELIIIKLNKFYYN